MRILLLSSSVLLSVAGASAQVHSASNLVGGTVVAGASSAAPLVPGTDVWPGLMRSASGWVGWAAANAGHSVTSTAVDLQWTLDAQAWSNGTSIAQLDVHYELSSPLLQRGHLIVDWQPTVVGVGQSSLSVDLFADGYIDADGAAVIPVAFQQMPLALRIRAEVSAQAGTAHGPWGTSWSWAGDAEASLRVRFVPSHATAIAVAVQPCPTAPVLAAVSDLHEGVELTAAAAAAFDIGLFALGFAGLDAPLPMSQQCRLLVDPAIVIAQPIPANRTVIHAVRVPMALRPAVFRTQFVALDVAALELAASDALQIAIQ